MIPRTLFRRFYLLVQKESAIFDDGKYLIIFTCFFVRKDKHYDYLREALSKMSKLEQLVLKKRRLVIFL